MSNENDIRHGRHCVFLMHVHLVFVAKYRREVFTKAILDDLRGIFASVCADFETELVEFDGEDDHVHLLAPLPTQGRGIQAGEQPERHVQPDDPQEELSEHSQEAMGRCAVVTVLLCRKLWGRTDLCHPAIHRATANAALKTNAKDGYAVRATTNGSAFRRLPRPEGRGLSRTRSSMPGAGYWAWVRRQWLCGV